jgi:aquaporin NIP
VSRSLAVRCLGEVAGTALLVGIGTGSIVAAARVGGLLWTLPIAWFFAVTVPVLLFAHSTGAHFNPAVTLGLTLGGHFPKREAPAYAAAQMLGAFGGSLGVLFLLGREASLGSTVPAAPSLLPIVFVGEAAFTFLLVLAVLGLARSDLRRLDLRLLLPGAVVGLSTLLIGPISGSSLNPARTLAPAILSGTYQDLWLYLIAVPLGALLAVPLEDAAFGSRG